MPIRYAIGDALEPAYRPAIIPHIVNDINRFGSGFAGAMAAKWPHAKAEYHAWARQEFEFPLVLGLVRWSPVTEDIVVVHMCAQHGLRGPANPHPLALVALDQCLGLVARTAVRFPGYTLHMPRIGCGLSGGTWAEVEPLIQRHLSQLDVTVYDLPQEAP